MKKVLLLITLLLSMSCGGAIVIPECTYLFEVDGVTICAGNEVDPVEISKTIKWVEEKTQVHYPQVTNLANTLAKNNVWIFFLDIEGYLATNCFETLFEGVYVCDQIINGQNRDGIVLLSRYHSCLAYTALGHEILHSVEIFYLKDIAGDLHDHMTPYLFEEWGQANNKFYETVERQVTNQGIQEFDSCK